MGVGNDVSNAESTIKTCRTLTEEWRRVVFMARTRLTMIPTVAGRDREYCDLWETAYELERRIRELHLVLHRALDIEPDMHDPRTAP